MTHRDCIEKMMALLTLGKNNRFQKNTHALIFNYAAMGVFYDFLPRAKKIVNFFKNLRFR